MHSQMTVTRGVVRGVARAWPGAWAAYFIRGQIGASGVCSGDTVS